MKWNKYGGRKICWKCWLDILDGHDGTTSRVKGDTQHTVGAAHKWHTVRLQKYHWYTIKTTNKYTKILWKIKTKIHCNITKTEIRILLKHHQHATNNTTKSSLLFHKKNTMKMPPKRTNNIIKITMTIPSNYSGGVTGQQRFVAMINNKHQKEEKTTGRSRQTHKRSGSKSWIAASVQTGGGGWMNERQTGAQTQRRLINGKCSARLGSTRLRDRGGCWGTAGTAGSGVSGGKEGRREEKIKKRKNRKWGGERMKRNNLNNNRGKVAAMQSYVLARFYASWRLFYFLLTEGGGRQQSGTVRVP